MNERQSYTDLNVVFHHPGPITSNGLTGSQVRPFKILTAFRELGINVETVVGNRSERKKAIKRIKHDIRNGKQFNFVYSENRTIPFAMTEEHRLPLHPFLDHRFLAFCNHNGIHVAMFYRDVFWRDESYHSMLPLWGRMITVPLYWFDWYYHTKYINTLYLPSMRMEKSLPISRGKMELKALPPGADIKTCSDTEDNQPISGRLRILYVGGVEPPTYDLTPLLISANQSPSTELTICCREPEWIKYRSRYDDLINERVNIVHTSGAGLDKLYAASDVHAIIRNTTNYLDFAVPVKLFETISHRTPVIATPGTEAARIVDLHNLGWVRSLEQMPHFLEELAHQPERIRAKVVAITKEIHNLTWQARVRQIIRDILKWSL
jgi:hypothetical protein